MNIEQIAEKLEAAGCDIVTSGDKVYIRKTPNGSKGQYGYAVAADDVRDILENVTKRNGELGQILRA